LAEITHGRAEPGLGYDSFMRVRYRDGGDKYLLTLQVEDAGTRAGIASSEVEVYKVAGRFPE
jgi:hypothetical protein